QPSEGPAQLGSLAIEFADGSKKTIGDYEGKVVLLDFWATYCQPCIKKLPQLQELQQRYGGDKLVVVAVSLDPDVKTAVAWAKANDIVLPIAKFTDDMRKAFFGGEETIAIPQARLIGKNGELLDSWGPDGAVEQIEAAIKRALEAL
ncbi:MAG: TlpA family protein disulfide reductase, partial [Armatimonadetes bacterium]|nr:TlpA family protein disulfide reductase [Armatimonadota bacterium]